MLDNFTGANLNKISINDFINSINKYKYGHIATNQYPHLPTLLKVNKNNSNQYRLTIYRWKTDKMVTTRTTSNLDKKDLKLAIIGIKIFE